MTEPKEGVVGILLCGWLIRSIGDNLGLVTGLQKGQEKPGGTKPFSRGI